MPDQQLAPPVAGQFEDADPEDAWSASDTITELLANIDSRLRHMETHPAMGLAERGGRLHRLRVDVRFIHGRVRRASVELFGPDIERDGRVADLEDR